MSEERKTIVKWLGTEEIDVDLIFEIALGRTSTRKTEFNATIKINIGNKLLMPTTMTFRTS